MSDAVGEFGSLDADGGTVDIYVLRDTAIVFQDVIEGTVSVDFDVEGLEMPAGSTLSLVVGYGPNEDYVNDMTRLSGSISCCESQ